MSLSWFQKYRGWQIRVILWMKSLQIWDPEKFNFGSKIKEKSQMIHNLWILEILFSSCLMLHFLSNSTIFTPNSIHKIFTTISTFLCNFHSLNLWPVFYTSYKTNRTVSTVFHILEQYFRSDKIEVMVSIQ